MEVKMIYITAKEHKPFGFQSSHQPFEAKSITKKNDVEMTMEISDVDVQKINKIIIKSLKKKLK